MKRKILYSVLLAVIVFVLASGSAFAIEYLLGDVDKNGVLEASDARSVLRYSLELDSPSEVQKKLADADGDGSLTPGDARLVLRMSLQLEKTVHKDIDDPDITIVDDDPDSPEAVAFRSVLYDVAHKYYSNSKGYGWSFSELHPVLDPNHSPLEFIYGTAGKWCCYYTVHDVFRPALRQAGYSEERIEELAPIYYSKKTIATALTNILASETNDYKDVAGKMKLQIPSLFVPARIVPFYIPSVLMDYYQNAPEDVCTTYTLHEYYDDVVTDSLIDRSANAYEYEPEIGDIIFMSNKSRTYSHGYPTVDHTAQIIDVREDGMFLCTEGSIILENQPDGEPRVRERWYYYSSKNRTYYYENNSIVMVLAAVKPKL